MQTAMESCLAEYNRVLLDRYDLFYVDASYGSGAGNEVDITEHLEGYISKNLGRTSLSEFIGARDVTALSASDVDITDSRYACDGFYTSVREQIYAYMMAGPEGALASNFWELFYTTESYDEDDVWESTFDECVDEFESAREEAEEEDDDEEEHEGRSAGLEALDQVSDILDDIRGVLGSAFLSQVGRADVSGADIYGYNLLSSRDLHYGTTYEAENSHHYSEAGSLLMMQYIMEKCSTRSEPLDDSVLQYEAEYILFGHSSDEENLEQMTARLVLLRAACDLYAIRHVTQCTATADLIAAALQIFPGIPYDVTRNLILVIWAYAEAIADVRTLYDGGSVPLSKSDSNWQTSLGNLFSSGGGRSDGAGLDYAMYLRIFLLAEDMADPNTVTERLLDVIEVDVEKAQDGIPLYMDYCLDAMAAECTITSGFGYSCKVQSEITYN